MGKVQAVFSSVRHETAARDHAIAQMLASLTAIEAERKECIAATLREHGKILFNIAYMAHPDIERLLFDESRKLNEWMISNRATVADLRARMLTSELVLAEQLEHKCADRLHVWKLLQQERATLDLLRVVCDDSAYQAHRDTALSALGVDAARLHVSLTARLRALMQVVPEGVPDESLEERLRVAEADVADGHWTRNTLHGQVRLRNGCTADVCWCCDMWVTDFDKRGMAQCAKSPAKQRSSLVTSPMCPH